MSNNKAIIYHRLPKELPLNEHTGLEETLEKYLWKMQMAPSYDEEDGKGKILYVITRQKSPRDCERNKS